MEEIKKNKRRPPCLLDDCFAISKTKTRCTILEPLSEEDEEAYKENEECPFYKPDPKGRVKRKTQKDRYKYITKKIELYEEEISEMVKELRIARNELKKLKIDRT